jgi:purine-nucleoside phosphorylase
MALITPRANITIEGVSAAYVTQIPASIGLRAGEALLAGAPCRVAADGLVYLSNATAANELARVMGWTGKAYSLGEPVTLHGIGAIFEYATGMTPGATLYVGATAGRLDDAATVGDAVGVAKVVTATHIVATRATSTL